MNKVAIEGSETLIAENGSPDYSLTLSPCRSFIFVVVGGGGSGSGGGGGGGDSEKMGSNLEDMEPWRKLARARLGEARASVLAHLCCGVWLELEPTLHNYRLNSQ